MASMGAAMARQGSKRHGEWSDLMSVNYLLSKQNECLKKGEIKFYNKSLHEIRRRAEET